MANPDYYKTLGVPRGAKTEEIRKAYRRLARKFHPDVNPGDKAAEERFKSMQEAYDVLGDAKKKQMYDQHGFYSASGVPPGAEGPRQGPEMGFGGFDFSDFFTQATAGGRPAGAGSGRFGDVFSQFFGRGAAAEPKPRKEKGADLEYAVNIDFWQSIRGAQLPLSVTHFDGCAACGGSGRQGGQSTACPECNGSGQVTQTAGAMRFSLTCPRCAGEGRLKNVCPTCHGEGRVSRSETVEVRIPAGVQTGARLRVPGKGNAGTQGASSGDLYITIRVEPHAYFGREGDNILIQVPITVDRSGPGREDRSSHHRWPRVAQDPHGHPELARNSACERKACPAPAAGRAGTRSWRSWFRLPGYGTSEPRNCCGSWPCSTPRTRAARCGRRCKACPEPGPRRRT